MASECKIWDEQRTGVGWVDEVIQQNSECQLPCQSKMILASLLILNVRSSELTAICPGSPAPLSVRLTGPLLRRSESRIVTGLWVKLTSLRLCAESEVK